MRMRVGTLLTCQALTITIRTVMPSDTGASNMRYIIPLIMGVITFCMAIELQGLPIPQDEVTWVWNLGCTAMGLGGMLLMFVPIVLYLETLKTK
jgi:hypothetical protein